MGQYKRKQNGHDAEQDAVEQERGNTLPQAGLLNIKHHGDLHPFLYGLKPDDKHVQLHYTEKARQSLQCYKIF